MATKAAILKMTSLKINRLLATAKNDMHMKFETEIPLESRVMLRKPYDLQNPKTKNPIWLPGGQIWEWHTKSIDFYPCTQVLFNWSLELTFEDKPKLEPGNQNI